MIRFTTFLTLVVGGMAAIQPVAARNFAGLSARINLGPANFGAFQRRQNTCGSVCSPVNSVISSGQCTPSECCSASFENTYFNCFACVVTFSDLTDYTVPQSAIDKLYDECASLGIQLPVLTFPGQNPNRTLYPVVQSKTTDSILTSLPDPVIDLTTFLSTTATSAQATTATSTPTRTSTSSGITSVETDCFHLIASAMMLGTWLYFAVY